MENQNGETRPTVWTNSRVETNQIHLRVQRGGHGDLTIVMLHGITDSGDCWRRVANVLAADYEIVLLDARGHGLSDRPATGYSMLDHAADVAGVIEALELDRPVIMGHSMGAAVAAAVGAQYPAMTRALVLEDPPWSGRLLTPSESEEMGAQWRASLAYNQAMSLPDLIAHAAQEFPHWHPEEREPWATSKHQASPVIFEMAFDSHMRQERIMDKIACPLLLLTADIERGAITPPEIAAQVAAYPNAQVAHIERAGHSIRRDQVDAYLEAVTAFLSKIDTVA